jgi:hypothetical protein
MKYYTHHYWNMLKKYVLKKHIHYKITYYYVTEETGDDLAVFNHLSNCNFDGKTFDRKNGQ